MVGTVVTGSGAYTAGEAGTQGQVKWRWRGSKVAAAKPLHLGGHPCHAGYLGF